MDNSSKSIDIFSLPSVTPSSSLPGTMLLFDNYDGADTMATFARGKSNTLTLMTILFLFKGEANFIVNGKDVNLRTGHIMVTSPDTRFEYKESSSDVRYAMIVVYPEIMTTTSRDINLTYDLSVYAKKVLTADCSIETMDYYANLYNLFKSELRFPDYMFKANVLRSYMNVLFVNIFNAFNDTNSFDVDPNSRQFDVYQKFLITLGEHFIQERSVEFYAKQLDISPKYLSFVSLQYSHKNASQWISDYVIAKAKALLTVHKNSAIEASEQLNFPSVNSFNRYFKRVTGMTPKEYIRTHKA